jgi:Mn2+/Fe2+ NRAMP family transporter
MNLSELYHKNRRRILLFLAVLGPGLITAIADNDAGGVATYTVAASLYGVASQFLIIPTTLLLALTQDVGARLAVVTRKGLADLIREQYGIKVSALVFTLYYVVNQGVVLQNISGLKASYELFNIPSQIPLVLTCILLIAFVVRFSYKNLQKIFFLLLFFYFSYVIVAVIVHPDWIALAKETVYPQKIQMNVTYWFSLIAVLGTTVTAWGQFFVSSYINDKKLVVEQLKYERLEIYVGAILTNLLSFMIAVAVASTLFVTHTVVSGGADAALALKPLAGESAFALFATGLFGASILGLTIVPLATAYVFAELFGYEGSLDTDFKSGRLFYLFFIIQIVFALLATLIPQVNLFRLTLYVDFLNGATLPFIFFFLIRFSEDPEIMGEHVLKGFSKIFLRVSAVLIMIAVLVSTFGKIFKIV